MAADGTMQPLGTFLQKIEWDGSSPYAPRGFSVVPYTGQVIYLPKAPPTTPPSPVLIDAYWQPGDTDDTASLMRAAAAGVPILCGSRTYRVAGVSIGDIPSLVLRGAPGCVIQRANASGSQFFSIAAASVEIDGVTFDMNKNSITANQWGVFLNRAAGSQSVTISGSVFKNNSGSLGTCLTLIGVTRFVVRGSEITGCTFNPLFIGSSSGGEVSSNYIHDNATSGMYVQSYGGRPSSDITIASNRFVANAGTGLTMGSFGAPYTYGNAAAVNIRILNNTFLDNAGYQLGFVNSENVVVVGNSLGQSSPSISTMGGIDCNSRYFLIDSNNLFFPAAGYGIDCGGAVEPAIRNNSITLGGGTGIAVGGTVNATVNGNRINLSGGGVAVSAYDMETDGALNPFPYHASNIVIQNNDIVLNGATTSGVWLRDNAGATDGAMPVHVIGNRFVGPSSGQAINYFGSGSGVIVRGNTHNGASGVPVSLTASRDYVFDIVYDYVQGDLAGGAIRSIVSSFVSAYGGGSSVIYVTGGGGSGYTSATTLSASGSCTWKGVPLIARGVILGVRTNSLGTGCGPSTVITASDSGGGTGAVFSAGVKPTLPSRKEIQFRAAENGVLQTAGGYIGVNAGGPIPLNAGGTLVLTASVGGIAWYPSSVPAATYSIGTLPGCGASYNGASATVTGSVTGKWQARCNGTNWLWPDGAVVVD